MSTPSSNGDQAPRNGSVDGEKRLGTSSSSHTLQMMASEENDLPASYLRLSRISCTPCRKRKLRCDRVRPCSTCCRRGIADSCYRDEPAEGGKEKSGSADGVNGRKGSTGQSVKQHHHSHTYSEDSAAAQRKRRRSGTAMTASNSASLQSSPENERLSDAHATSLERSLVKARHQLGALVAIARDSGSSIDSLLQKLQAKEVSPDRPVAFGSGRDGLVRWREVAPYLLSIEECEERIRFYFEDLSIYLMINQRSTVERDWQRLIEGPGLEPNKVAVICTIMAIADGTAPPLSRIRNHPMQEHDAWVKLMGDPLVTAFEHQVDNSLDRVMTLGLLSIYYLYMGRHDRLWECMGAAVRKGFIVGLFDERHKAWHGLSNIEKEYRRRLAWYLVSLERLQAFMRQLPFALHPDSVYLALPSFASDALVASGHNSSPHINHTFPMTMSDGRLQTHASANDGRVVKFVMIELVAVCHEFLTSFKSTSVSQRYNRALQIDDLLERTLLDGLTDTGVDLSDLATVRFLSTQALDGCRKEKQLGVHLFVSSIFFLRCIITRRFLVDESAPPSLRFVSLTYAQGIVSTTPSLTRMIKEGRLPIQLTWSANHLLCAATAFAVVILGHDPYAGIDSDPTRSINGTARVTSFPKEQVQWLADNIFSTLECLGMLVERGNAAAVTAKRLLERLCRSQDELRSLYSKRFHPITDVDGPLHAFRTPLPYSSTRARESAPGTMSISASRESPYNAPSPWARSPSSTHGHGSPALVGPSLSNSLLAPSPSAWNRQPLPPIQPYPPPPPSPRGHAGVATSSALPAQPIVGRLTNASSLLDAVLMDPADLYSLDQSELLFSMLQQEASPASVSSSGNSHAPPPYMPFHPSASAMV